MPSTQTLWRRSPRWASVRAFCREKSHFRHGACHAGTRLGAEHFDAWFARTAQKPYTRTVLFATVYALSQVVFVSSSLGTRSVSDHEDKRGALLISLYNKT